MKSFKLLVASAFVFVLLTPVFVSRAAYGDEIISTDTIFVELICNWDDGQGVTEGCDLAIDKQVSINDGPFVPADTSADAAQAQVGDTVTWKIVVTNESDEEMVPHGFLTVSDALPLGVEFDSYTASVGTYGSNQWVFSLEGVDGSNLPATLTIVSHSTMTGLFQNTASLAFFAQCGECTEGTYTDSDPTNNSNDAWFDPAAAPVVLGESTPVVLAATGNGIAESLVAAGLIVSTLGLLGYSRFARKEN